LIRIKRAELSDIVDIQHIASVTWPVAYSDILSPRQMSYMLNAMYNQTKLAAQMQEEEHLFFIAKLNGAAVGFAGISSEDYPFPVDKNIPENVVSWKLHKLYVLPHIQKSGAGKALMEAVKEAVLANGGNYLLLNVNRKNPSYQYYLKNGFEVLEAGDFDIGSGFFMNDYIMGKSL
jgi:GNAT superfamily N-acetyltransferase